MNINDVITLDNDAQYLVLDILEMEKTYAYCVGMYPDAQLDYEDFLFFLLEQDKDGYVVEKVEDKEIIQKLLILESSVSLADSKEEHMQIAQEISEKVNKETKKEDDK